MNAYKVNDHRLVSDPDQLLIARSVTITSVICPTNQHYSILCVGTYTPQNICRNHLVHLSMSTQCTWDVHASRTTLHASMQTCTQFVHARHATCTQVHACHTTRTHVTQPACNVRTLNLEGISTLCSLITCI